jgi:hypothetical protein
MPLPVLYTAVGVYGSQPASSTPQRLQLLFGFALDSVGVDDKAMHGVFHEKCHFVIEFMWTHATIPNPTTWTAVFPQKESNDVMMKSLLSHFSLQFLY